MAARIHQHFGASLARAGMAHGAYAKRRVAGRSPSLGTSYAARSSRNLGARSKEWDKKAIRNQIRFIERLLKRALPLEIKTAHEKRLEDLKWQAELHLHRNLALRDRKLKFFERRKLERRIRRLEKRYRSNLDQQQNNEDEAMSARRGNDITTQLNRLKEDLEYVRFFPKSERYLSLFMGGEDELTSSRRKEIHEKIKARRASAVASGHELEETGSEDDEPMDLSDDDMFAEGSSSDDADADDEWTDRPGDDREDTSRETGPSPITLHEAAPQQRERFHSQRREECARMLMPPPRATSQPSSSSGVVVGVRSRNRLNYVSSSNSEEAMARTSSSGISSDATRFVRKHHVLDGGDDDDRDDDDSSSSDSNASFSCKKLDVKLQSDG